MKIVGVALNYVDHKREVDLETPDRPLIFAKWPSAVIADGTPIVIPAGVEQVAYKAELAVVILGMNRARGPDALANRTGNPSTRSQ